MTKKTKGGIAILFLYAVGVIGLGVMTHWSVPLFVWIMLVAYKMETLNK